MIFVHIGMHIYMYVHVHFKAVEAEVFNTLHSVYLFF